MSTIALEIAGFGPVKVPSSSISFFFIKLVDMGSNWRRALRWLDSNQRKMTHSKCVALDRLATPQ